MVQLTPLEKGADIATQYPELVATLTALSLDDAEQHIERLKDEARRKGDHRLLSDLNKVGMHVATFRTGDLHFRSR